MTAPAEGFPSAVLKKLAGPPWEDGGQRILVALSGGLDSMVLLHLLRFHPGVPALDLRAAHFDHRMREESARDAQWVKGVCTAWEVPLSLGRAVRDLSSEAEAREARYEFLLGTKASGRAAWLFTAHHGDDQAETVLFRIFRGTGLAGLSGIPSRRSPGIFRPLLDVSRAELEAYARDAGIRVREDPSNRNLWIPRNAIRHSILPEVEERVASGARASLRRLARLARENEEAWRSILPGLLEGVLEEDSRGIYVVRSRFLAYHPAVRGRLLRAILKSTGVILDEAGTRRVLEFTRCGASGRVLDLPGGMRIRREFHRFLLERRKSSGEERGLIIPGPQGAAGRARLGGRSMVVKWGGEEWHGARYRVGLPLFQLEFPLHLRGWQPGDRITLSYGRKKLKKLLAEASVPAGARKSVPVLVDNRGRILWVAGAAVAASMAFPEDGTLFFIGIDYADES